MQGPMFTTIAVDAVVDDEWSALGGDAAAVDALVAQLDVLSGRLVERRAALRSTGAGSSTTVRAGLAADLAAAAARLRRLADVVTVVSTQIATDACVPLNEGMRSDRKWLAVHSGISFRDACVVVRAAELEDRFPEVADAFTAGQMQLGHADAVGGIIPPTLTGDDLELAVQIVQDLQERLIEEAQKLSVDDFAAFCKKIRRRLDQDGPGDRTVDPSTVWIEQTFGGRWVLTGDLCADDGALIATMLTERMETIRYRLKTEHSGDQSFVMPTERELRAMALRELMVDGAGSNQTGRVGVFLHINLEDLAIDRTELEVLTGGMAHTEADLDISDDTLWALLADADVVPVFNHDGHPLSYGRTRRLAPDILRRVLAHRDRRCCFPGCDLPAARSQMHHVEHWETEGTTDPANMTNGCRFHHLGHHNGRPTIGFAPEHDGTPGSDVTKLVFKRVDGTTITGEPAYRERSTTGSRLLERFGATRELDDRLIRERVRHLVSLRAG